MGALAVLPRFTVAFALAIALPHADRQEKDLGDEATSLVTLKKVLNKAFAIANGSGSDTVWMNNVKTEPVNVTVFYHLFLRNLQDKERVAGIVRNQLKQIPAMSLSEISEIRINSVGAPVNIADVKVSPELEKKTQVLAHYTEGWEKVTLHDLWSFCREKNTDPNQIVVYLHSKGSKAMYDAYGQEVKSRHSAYVTTGAVSQECLHMPNYCNICSTRMSPLPYMQTPGNMWAARCGHVAQLKDPKNFDQDMLKVQDAEKTELDMCIGTSHFAAEHWVYAHPAAAPCDLDTSVMYSGPWKINQDPPKELYAKELKKAPRFELQAYHWPDAPCQGWGEALPRHLAEYRVLYGTEPAADWRGWIFFKQS